jgi:hypothetical protein
MDIRIGYTGGKIVGGKDEPQNRPVPMSTAELASALALPFAIFRPGNIKPEDLLKAEMPKAELPKAPLNTAILILALPRTFVETSALENFLKKLEAKQETEIVFLYTAEENKTSLTRQNRASGFAELEDAARSCVNLYSNKRYGIHATKVVVRPALEREEGNNGSSKQ